MRRMGQVTVAMLAALVLASGVALAEVINGNDRDNT